MNYLVVNSSSRVYTVVGLHSTATRAHPFRHLALGHPGLRSLRSLDSPPASSSCQICKLLRSVCCPLPPSSPLSLIFPSGIAAAPSAGKTAVLGPTRLQRPTTFTSSLLSPSPHFPVSVALPCLEVNRQEYMCDPRYRSCARIDLLPRNIPAGN